MHKLYTYILFYLRETTKLKFLLWDRLFRFLHVKLKSFFIFEKKYNTFEVFNPFIQIKKK